MHRLTRRRFLASLPPMMAPALIGCRAERQRLRIAAVGASGKGWTDITCCEGENFVAICDVDENLAARARKAHPKANFFTDWRKMFDREARNFDAVTISTPDHLHAVIASHAIKLGKHVYCQKPLTLTVHELSYVCDLAKASGVVTQMGNQGSADNSFRRAVEIIRAGVIGDIREIYVWSDRPIWPQGMRQVPEGETAPPGFNWDGWLGPAPYRPFHRGTYHPFNWRAWYDFGTGALGDMGCHLLNLPFRAAQLNCPASVEPLKEIGSNPETYPSGSRIRFRFPAGLNRAATDLYWSDGVENVRGLPQNVRTEIQDLLGTVAASGCLMIGERGMALSPGDYGERFFLKLDGEREWAEASSHPLAQKTPASLPRIHKRGYADLKHHYEWISACKEGTKTFSSFEIACPLTQIVLLGCIALRAGAAIEIDPQSASIKGPKEAVHLMGREYRKGWELA